jgi:hypothetical protein
VANRCKMDKLDYQTPHSIESLGNYISQEILLNKELGAVKQWLTDVKWTS